MILAACDAMIAPTRYEPYGLGVHEAMCRGLPALVSSDAGVAERYPPALGALLLHDAGSAREVGVALERWRARSVDLRAAVAAFSPELRARSWDDMAREMVAFSEAARAF